MRLKLEGITVLAHDVPRLTSFYRDVLGFKTVVEENHYAEFVNGGIRLAICSTPLMADNTNGHYSFIEERKGQAFELNFECDSPEAVHTMYEELISKGLQGSLHRSRCLGGIPRASSQIRKTTFILFLR